MKRIFSVAFAAVVFGVAIAVLAGTLVSCGGKKKFIPAVPSTSADVPGWTLNADKPIQFDWYIHFSWFNRQWGTSRVSKYITEKTGVDVRFIGVIGDDPGGELIRNSSARMGLNIEHSLFLKSEGPVTSVYIALMDSNGVMKIALADMDIIEQMTVAHIESKAAVIKESAIVVLDTNLPEPIIIFILDNFSGVRFFLDAVSAKKAPRAASRIGLFDTIKLSNVEAQALSGIEAQDLQKEADWFINMGVRNVFITLGKEGVFYARAGMSFLAPARYVPPVNTSGGGDAFMAGIVYGTLQGWDEKAIVSFSLAMAGITVQSKFTVSPDMSLELIQDELIQDELVQDVLIKNVISQGAKP
jgi:pseudouridine kinase